MTKNTAELKDKILKGLDLTYQKLLKTKSDRNLDLVISKNGKAVTVDPRTYTKKYKAKH